MVMTASLMMMTPPAVVSSTSNMLLVPTRNTATVTTGDVQPPPTANDILFGRGRFYQDHPGNIKFLDIVQKYKPFYQMDGMTHAKKRNIVLQVLAEVKNNSSSSSSMIYSDYDDDYFGSRTRFLKLHPRHQNNEERLSMNMGSCEWILATDEEIMKKVSHCLREKIRPTKKIQRQEHCRLQKKKAFQGPSVSAVPDCISSLSKSDATSSDATATMAKDTELIVSTTTATTLAAPSSSCSFSPVTVLDPQIPLLDIMTTSTKFPTFSQVLFSSSSLSSSCTKPALATTNNNTTSCESVLDLESAQLLLEILN